MIEIVPGNVLDLVLGRAEVSVAAVRERARQGTPEELDDLLDGLAGAAVPDLGVEAGLRLHALPLNVAGLELDHLKELILGQVRRQLPRDGVRCVREALGGHLEAHYSSCANT